MLGLNRYSDQIPEAQRSRAQIPLPLISSLCLSVSETRLWDVVFFYSSLLYKLLLLLWLCCLEGKESLHQGYHMRTSATQKQAGFCLVTLTCVQKWMLSPSGRSFKLSRLACATYCYTIIMMLGAVTWCYPG